jgi:hypothetical protein
MKSNYFSAELQLCSALSVSLTSLAQTDYIFQNFHKQVTVRDKLQQQQKERCRHRSIFTAEIEFVF